MHRPPDGARSETLAHRLLTGDTQDERAPAIARSIPTFCASSAFTCAHPPPRARAGDGFWGILATMNGTSTQSASPGSDDGGLPYFVGVVALVLAFAGAFAVMPRIFKQHETPLAGKVAPDFHLDYVVNAPPEAPTTLASFHGKAVVLDFWATWCGPCQAQSPVLDRIAKRYADRGVVVLGINTSDGEGAAKRWIARHGISYPIAYDQDNHAAHLYGVVNLPTLVVLSREGKIVAVREGFTDTSELESILKRVL